MKTRRKKTVLNLIENPEHALKTLYLAAFFVYYISCFFDEGRAQFMLFSPIMAAVDEFGAAK